MFQWYRTMMANARARVEARAKGIEQAPRIEIGLASMPGAIRIAEGMPQPQWALIQHELKSRFSSADQHHAWHWASVEWLNILREALGPAFHLDETDNFLLLTAKSLNSRRSFAQRTETALARLRNQFGDAARKTDYGKYVVIRMEDEDSYYRYVSNFYEEGEHPTSGAVFLDLGFRHILLKPTSKEDGSIAHELTHCVLADLPHPKWLKEGLAQEMEPRVAGRRTGARDDIFDRHQEFWNAQSIREFWTGQSFRVGGDSRKLSYHLALVLMQILYADHPKGIAAFVGEAHFADSGQEAAQKHFGATLGALAGTFLGPGDWEPPPPLKQLRDKGRPKNTRLMFELVRARRFADVHSILEKSLEGARDDAERAELLRTVADFAMGGEECAAFASDALKLAERARALSGESGDDVLVFAGLLTKLGRYEEGAELLRVIAAWPEPDFQAGCANYLLALAEHGMGHHSEAEAAYQKAVALAPKASLRHEVDHTLHGPPPEDEEYWKHEAPESP